MLRVALETTWRSQIARRAWPRGVAVFPAGIEHHILFAEVEPASTMEAEKQR
jgi:hypothetical protein